jgi:hypothetical protein
VPWQVYPNPSQGNFYLVFQLNKNEKLHAKVYDANGRLVKENQLEATGFMQKLSIDLSNTTHAGGIYLLRIKAGDKEQSYKMHKL